MTTYHGNDGVVEVGANAVAEVDTFSISTTVETSDDTVKGDAWNTHLLGRKGWTGSITCKYDPGDTNGQVLLIEGASVSLTLYPTGDASGRQSLSGTATITGVDIDSPNDTVGVSFAFQGNGALTRATVS